MNYNMAKYSGKTCRLLTMLSMTASFFLVEIIVGYITNSIALVADSFHMLSDVVALIVGFASVRVSIATLFLLDSTVVLQYTVESLGFVEA